MPEYEYRIYQSVTMEKAAGGLETVLDSLQALGRAGWEIIGFSLVRDPGGELVREYLMKRPRSGPTSAADTRPRLRP